MYGKLDITINDCISWNQQPLQLHLIPDTYILYNIQGWELEGIAWG